MGERVVMAIVPAKPECQDDIVGRILPPDPRWNPVLRAQYPAP